LGFLLILGIGFRFIQLDHKIYWHDEVYTSMRAAGYLRHEIDDELFQNRLIAASELQKFQQIKPDSTMADTLHSLKQEDPQHPPLYFGMARWWMQQWGGSIAAARLLPVLISLFSLPLMYGLALELFHSTLAALLATTLLALSPFDLLFAQTARQYSLLTVTILASSWLLVKGMQRTPKAFNGQEGGIWLGYGLSVAIGLYTHPFFALTSVGHGVYAVALTGVETIRNYPPVGRDRLLAWLRDRRIWLFGLANGLALLLYSPWIIVLLDRMGRATATTDWTRENVGIWYLSKLWLLSFTALFFDLDFGFNNPITYLFRLPFFILVIAAFYQVYRRASRSASLFVFTSAGVPFLLLAIPDLIVGGKRSAVSRYLISCYPAIQLAVAYFLSNKLATGKRLWQGVLAFCLAGSILSAIVSARAETWWSKDLSYLNGEVIQAINAEAATRPILISDVGDDYTNTGDLISLSYGLDPSLRLFLVSHPPQWESIATEPALMVFRPSKAMEVAIDQQGWQLVPILEDAKLWRVQQ
jgi:uncharacterized membrane protein